MGQVLWKQCSASEKMDGCSSESKKMDDYSRSESKKIDGCSMERRPWSGLPDLPLYAIAMKLSSPFALCAFAGVCRSWRLVAKSHKSEFMASQPPILLLLPDIRSEIKSKHSVEARVPTSHSSSFFRFYSVIENQIYNIGRDQFSPILASRVSSKKYFILGYSYGFLITSSRVDRSSVLSDHIPSIVNLRTGKEITFPRCHLTPQRGILTSAPDSGSSMLILYEVCIYFVLVYCCRVGDPFGQVYVFNVPKAAFIARSVRNAIVHGGLLYVSIMGGEILVANASGIQPDAVANMLTVAWSKGIVMISLDGSLSEASIHNAFIDHGKLRGGLGGHMVEDVWYDPCASTYSLFWINAMEEGSLIGNIKALCCDGGDGIWVRPCDLQQQLGFKNVM